MHAKNITILTIAVLSLLSGCVVVPNNNNHSNQHQNNTSSEYDRGYNDGLKGYAFDNNRHPQDYKDGFRAGENQRSSQSAQHPANSHQQGGNTSIEYKRGYNDALKGNAYDTDRHPQDYKDGYRDGENARTQ